MAYTDLADFVRALERSGELIRIKAPVDPHLEVAGIVQRVVRERGPALLFENPVSGQMPLLMNLFGTNSRMCQALGVSSLDEIGDRIAGLLKPEVPQGFSGLRDALGKAAQLRNVPPRHGKRAHCQEVVRKGDEVDLNLLPGITSWPGDGGVFLNLGLTHTKHPETGARNLGMYRLQQQDSRTVSLHWQIHKDSTSHAAIAERRGERLPVAIAFGCPPAVTYAASAPLPADIDEYLFAGFLQRERVELVDCLTVPLQVPAHAQVVLEGWVEPGARLPEGPFGDHTGFYSLADDFPVFHITCITMRKKPTYLTTVVGIPPQEDVYLGKASERIFLPMIRKTIPEIVDMHFPPEGIFHNIVLISIDKRYPGHARKIMNAFWGLGQLMFSKTVIVFDKDVDVQNVSEAAWIAGTHVDPQRDIQFTVGPMDDLENASNLPAYGSKMGIDATRKWPGEGFTREFPTRLTTTDGARRKAEELLKSIAKAK